jgi:5'-3' exonuclease
VQVDRKAKVVRNEEAVAAKFGVGPALIADYLALVGDAQDGYPGVPGIGAVSAARLLRRYGPIEDFPADALNSQREAALLFKRLATLRTDAKLFANVDELRWRGPTPGFREWTERFSDPGLFERAAKAGARC